MISTEKVKIWLTCPVNETDNLLTIIGDAGIGVIGNYSHCSFITRGVGSSKPLLGANPAIGEVGSVEKIEEDALEFVCNISDIPKLKQILKDYHPYEEVAMDLIPLLEI